MLYVCCKNALEIQDIRMMVSVAVLYIYIIIGYGYRELLPQLPVAPGILGDVDRRLCCPDNRRRNAYASIEMKRNERYMARTCILMPFHAHGMAWYDRYGMTWYGMVHVPVHVHVHIHANPWSYKRPLHLYHDDDDVLISLHALLNSLLVRYVRTYVRTWSGGVKHENGSWIFHLLFEGICCLLRLYFKLLLYIWI